MIELLKFCRGPGARPGYDRPFNHHGWTFATDGNIVVRVPQQPMWMERQAEPELAQLLFDHASVPAQSWMDPARLTTCCCAGGFVRFGRHCLGLHYVQLLKDLPSIRLAPEASAPGELVRFAFLQPEDTAVSYGYVLGACEAAWWTADG